MTPTNDERELVSRLLEARARCWPEDMTHADGYFDVLHEATFHADAANVIDTLTRWLLATLMQAKRDGQGPSDAVGELVHGIAAAEMGQRNADDQGI